MASLPSFASVGSYPFFKDYILNVLKDNRCFLGAINRKINSSFKGFWFVYLSL